MNATKIKANPTPPSAKQNKTTNDTRFYIIWGPRPIQPNSHRINIRNIRNIEATTRPIWTRKSTNNLNDPDPQHRQSPVYTIRKNIWKSKDTPTITYYSQ